jgi:hypothetical protein
MISYVIKTITAFALFLPLQVFACTSFEETLFKGFIFYSLAIVLFFIVSLFLIKIFGGKKTFTIFKKCIVWFSLVFFVLMLTFTLYLQHKNSGIDEEEIECVGAFCNPLC